MCSVWVCGGLVCLLRWCVGVDFVSVCVCECVLGGGGVLEGEEACVVKFSDAILSLIVPSEIPQQGMSEVRARRKCEKCEKCRKLP